MHVVYLQENGVLREHILTVYYTRIRQSLPRYYDEVTCAAKVPHFTQLRNKQTIRREEAMVEENINK
jgi:hypothetical protein